MAKKPKQDDKKTEDMATIDEAMRGAAENANGAPPSLQVLGQYLKDLSFENPGAPDSVISMENQPQVDVGVNVNAQRRDDGHFEVELHIDVKAHNGGTAVFAVEMQYGGVFALENVPDEVLQAIVLIECPRMLFPFARQIVADAIRDGGFPPLMLDPIDFAALYQQRMTQEQAQV